MQAKFFSSKLNFALLLVYLSNTVAGLAAHLP